MKLLLFILSKTRPILSNRYVKLTIVSVTIITSLILALPYAIHLTASTLYSKNDFSNSSVLWNINSKISFYDRYIMLYNSGNSEYRKGDMLKAVDRYESSMTTAPESKICMIKWNTALSLATEARNNEMSKATEAIGLYSRALFHLSYKSCSDQDEYKDNWKHQSKQLEEKIKFLKNKLDEDNGKTKYKPTNQPKEATEADRKNSRNKRVQQSIQTQSYNERQNLSNEDKADMYREMWW